MRHFIFLVFLLSCRSVYAVYDTIDPLREDTQGGFLGDIDSRALNVEIYRDPDVVTWAHECTHSVNSRIRQHFKVKNGYYLLRGKVFYLRHNPKFTLSDVADKIPNDERGEIFPLYMQQQTQYWDDTPLYILDECISYLNGTIVGIEKGNITRAKDSFWRCEEMFRYAVVAQNMCQETSFEEQKDLDLFMLRLGERLKYIKETLNHAE